MWEINNFSQILSFLYSFILGSIYCIVYDVIRAARKGFRCSDFAVFLQDIIFWLLCAVTCFCFLLSVTYGEIRAYIIIGIIFGFIVFRLTVSRVLYFILLRIMRALNFIFKKTNHALLVFFAFCDKEIEAFFKKTGHFLKIAGISLKKLLKKTRGLLYTKSDRVI